MVGSLWLAQGFDPVLGGKEAWLGVQKESWRKWLWQKVASVTSEIVVAKDRCQPGRPDVATLAGVQVSLCK